MFLDKFVSKFQSTSEKVMSMLFLLNLNTINMCPFPVHNMKTLVDRCFGVCISHPLPLHHHLLHLDSLPVPLPTPVPLPLLPLPLHVSLSLPLYHLTLSPLSLSVSLVLFPLYLYLYISYPEVGPWLPHTCRIADGGLTRRPNPYT